MTFGARWLCGFATLLLTLFIGAGEAAARSEADIAASSSFDFGKLMAEFRKLTEATGQFTERKYMSMLSEPLESSGTLVYFAPDHLEKYTSKPQQERLIVDGDQITVDQGQENIRTLSVEESPEVGGLIESIRGTLSGDAPALERYFAIEFRGTDAAWVLTLTPKGKRMLALVQSIHIAGSLTSIQTIETRERNGDYSVITITEVGR